jgi:dTDP-4-dehydrorhamnose 3,5-epimerase
MAFIFKQLPIPDLLLIQPKIFCDERGFFFEKYKQSDFVKYNIPPFVQDNCSRSEEGVIRGLHYQINPKAQGKLVSVFKGKVWDIAVDMRKNSPYFGKWEGVELSDENNLSFYIPPGFAHGFAVLSSEAILFYKCTNEYDISCERGVVWNDPDLNIDWKIANPVLSKKDKEWPLLNDASCF